MSYYKAEFTPQQGALSWEVIVISYQVAINRMINVKTNSQQIKRMKRIY